MKLNRVSLFLLAALLLCLNSCGLFQKEPEVIELDHIEYANSVAVAHYKDGYAHTIGDPMEKMISYIPMANGTYRACLAGNESPEPMPSQGLAVSMADYQQSVSLLNGPTIYAKTVERDHGQKTTYVAFDANEKAYQYYGHRLQVDMGQQMTELNFREDITISSVGSFDTLESLKSVTLPNSVRVLDGDLFARCKSLESVVIPEGVTELPANAFLCCPSLKSITLPSTLKKIGVNAVGGGGDSKQKPAGHSVYFNGTLQQWKDMVFEDTVEVPPSYFNSETTYQKIELSQTNPIHGAACFYVNGELLEELTVAQGYVTVSQDTFRAFEGYAGLKRVILPNSLTAMSDRLLDGFSNLQGQVLDGVTYLGSEENPYLVAYRYDSGDRRESVTVHQDCRFIYAEAFEGPHQLKEIVLGNGVTSIGSRAFARCHEIETFVMPDSVTVLGVGVFEECSRLQSVVFSNNLETVGGNLFGRDTSPNATEVGGIAYVGDAESPHMFAVGVWYDAPAELTVLEDCLYLDGTFFDNLDHCAHLNLPKGLKGMFYNHEEGRRPQGNYTFDITYAGTVEEWNAIIGVGLLGAMTRGTVHCTNGVVYLGKS